MPDGEKEARLSRYKRLQEAGGSPDELTLPDCAAGMFLVEWLFECGPCNKDDALSWSDINAWAQSTKAPIYPRDAVSLRQLSVAYYLELMQAKDKNRAAPYFHINESMRQKVADDIKSALRQIGQRKKGRRK